MQLYDNKMVYFEDEHAAGGPRGQFALDVRCDVCFVNERSTGVACWESVHVTSCHVCMSFAEAVSQGCRLCSSAATAQLIKPLACQLVAISKASLLLAAAVTLHHANNLQGCVVWEEGRKKAHYWTFNLVRETKDGEIVSMLRCSTEVRETFERWIQVC